MFTASYIPRPTDGPTFHHMSDLHLGSDISYRRPSDVIYNDRPARVVRDLAALRYLHEGHIHTGDAVDQGRQGIAWDYFTDYEAFRNDVIAGDGLPYFDVIGNHDMGSYSKDVTALSGDECAALLGMPDKNYTLDIAGMRFITATPDEWGWEGTGGDGVPAQLTYSATTVEWMHTQISAAGSMPVWICTHGAPHGQVRDTVATPRPFADMEALVGDHANVVGWLSGHYHIGDFSTTKVITMGGRRIFGLNAPTCGKVEAHNPIDTDESASFFVTYLGNECIVYWRDHRSLTWRTPIRLVRS